MGWSNTNSLHAAAATRQSGGYRRCARAPATQSFPASGWFSQPTCSLHVGQAESDSSQAGGQVRLSRQERFVFAERKRRLPVWEALRYFLHKLRGVRDCRQPLRRPFQPAQDGNPLQTPAGGHLLPDPGRQRAGKLVRQ